MTNFPRLFECLLAAMLTAGTATAITTHAAVFTVTTSSIDAHDADTNDGTCDDGSGNCTLRAAIEQADKLGGVNTINVPAGTYLLSAALGPFITNNGTNVLSINGTGGPGTVILDGQNATTILTLGGNGSVVNIDNLVFQNGKYTVPSPGAYGVCVGAGINVIYSVTVNVTNSIIRNNTAEFGSGGGICINFGTFTLDRSTVRDNTSTFGGGGIRIGPGFPPGKLIITNSLIANNTTTGTQDAAGTAGAIVTQATIDISNTTFSGNHVQGEGSVLIGVSGSKTTMRNVTLSGNTGSGGQIVMGNAGDTMTFESTILDNPPGGSTMCSGIGIFISNGSNMETGNSCNLTMPTDLTGANANLGPLQNNGGPTLTHALLPGSLAIDRGSNSLALAFDQRGAGYPRVFGASPDIGAFEYQSAGGTPTLDIDGSGAPTKYDPLTDGLLTLRYLFGLTGTSLIQSAIGGTATRTDAPSIKSYLDSIRNAMDIDGNGTADPLTDGLMIIRYLFGLRGAPLISNAIGNNATRTTAPQIEAQIGLLMP